MADNQERSDAGKMIGELVGLLDHVIDDPDLATLIGLHISRQMPEGHLDNFVSHLKSEKGQVHLQSLRNSIDNFLSAWP